MRTNVLRGAVALAVLAACGGTQPAQGGTISVVAAFYPLEEAARRVGGDLVRVINLTPPGAEPHDLELRPSDVVALRNADVVLYLGRGFQPAVERAVAALPRERAVDLLANLDLRPPPPGSQEESPVDPHVWLSPALMREIAFAVGDALSRRLPREQGAINQRLIALGVQLDQLGGEFTNGLAKCERREIFTSHAAFGYLAARYRLTQVPITGVEPEAEPSAKRLQQVAAEARRRGATTIFFETLVSPRVSQAVARIVGARTAVLDPLEGISEEDRAAGSDYFRVMRRNLAALRDALGCST